ncbi:MAG: beta-glucosidase, partial [Bacteroidota bacterium]
MKIGYQYLFLAFTLLMGCQSATREGGSSNNTYQSKYAGLSEDSLLNLIQYQTFQYFWENAEPTSGMARERTHLDGVYPQNDQNVVTSGGSGFGL